MFRISKDTPAYYLTFNYVHQNPVRAGLVKRAEDYRWSSVRCWARTEREDEPLLMDIDTIAWRTSKRGIASR